MMLFLLVAGIGLVLAGLAAIGFGIPVKEFSFGNTLIFTGTVAGCTGMIMLGLSMVVRELRTIGSRIARSPLPARKADHSAEDAGEDDGRAFRLDRPDPDNSRDAEPAASPAPWLEEATARDRVRLDAAAALPSSDPTAKQRRNLMFSSTMRRERERAEARAADPSAAELRGGTPIPPPYSDEGPATPSQEDWPQPERSRSADPPSQRRGNRTSSIFDDPAAGAPALETHRAAMGDAGPAEVVVLKSGVVDGMAYSLYSDGSIEAQMPEGMMRFASIDELRAHLEQRA